MDVVNLVMDVGNTRMKYAFFEGERLVGVRYLEGVVKGDNGVNGMKEGWGEMGNGGRMEGLVAEVMEFKEAGKRVDVLLAGSGRIGGGMRERLAEVADFLLEASPSLPLPLKIGYGTPGTLGFDRIASCTGAVGLFPGVPLLVVDSGTCITYNYVDAEGTFLGGNISPGVGTRFRSLHHFTAKLPLLEPAEVYGGMGCTTEEAIRNGVMDGMLFEVEGYLRRFSETFENGVVVLTGGGASFLLGRLPGGVRYCKELGFIGLNKILAYAKKF